MELDIKERIIKNFGSSAPRAIEMIESFESRLQLSSRVSRSVVHLAKGDISKLAEAIMEAETDWRDVIVWAESVEFEFRKPFNNQIDE